MRTRAREASADPGGGPGPSHATALRPPVGRGHEAHLAGLQHTVGNAAVAFGIQRMSRLGGGRCACGGIAGPDGECAACRARRLNGLSVQRAPQTAGTPAPAERGPAPPEWLVEDGTENLAAGQATKTAWLSELRAAMCERADKEMEGTPHSTEGCPFIGFWIGYFAARPASEVGAAAVRYAPELAGVTSAAQAIGPLVDRVGAAVAVWVRTGQITGVPEGAGAGLVPGDSGAGGGETVQLKGRGGPGAPAAAAGGGAAGPGSGAGQGPGRVGAGAEPGAVLAQLGGGRPLDSGVRARMEPLFGQDFSGVRVHTDSGAASLSAGLDARAFTVGHHIALGSSEYQPGTIVGDALLAHELAHVVQQAGASRTTGPLRDGSPASDAFEQDADTSAAGAVARLWGGTTAAVTAGLAGAVPRLRAGLGVQRCGKTVYHCPKGKSWQRVAPPIGAGPVCFCGWKCLPGEEGRYTARSYSGQSEVRCPPGGCVKPQVEHVEISEDTIVTGEDGVTRDYSGDMKIAPGAHFTPLTGQPMCGCLPLDIKGKPTGEEVSYVPMLEHPGVELTDVMAGRTAKAMEGLSRGRGAVEGEPPLTRKAPMTQEPPPLRAPPPAKTPLPTPEPPPAVKAPAPAPGPPPAVKAPASPPEPPPAKTLQPPPAKTPEPPPAAPPTKAPAATTATPPSTPRTVAAAKRVADAEAALATARSQAGAARAKVAKAEGDLQAAQELAGEPGAGAEGAKLVRQATKDLQRERAGLRSLEASERVARSEATAAARGSKEVARLEAEIARLDAEINAELNPPGGFTAAQRAEGRRPGVIPALSAKEQPSGAKYHKLAGERAAALRALESETAGLTRTLSEQVAAATPGKAAQPAALSNAASLEPALRPVGGAPIDVTTGAPMKTTSWATDHIMSRTEIARDPRFARLTPAQRDAMLHEIPENFLPMTGPANSSKGGQSVDAWIAQRGRDGQPLPADVAKALRAADARARKAVEAKFKEFLP